VRISDRETISGNEVSSALLSRADGMTQSNMAAYMSHALTRRRSLLHQPRNRPMNRTISIAGGKAIRIEAISTRSAAI